MFGFVVCLILNIAPAQGAGIQNVAVFIRRAGNDSPVELRVVADDYSRSVGLRRRPERGAYQPPKGGAVTEGVYCRDAQHMR
ncbi:hypothetical protein [Pantoea ananatis]|uniref:hypothetical protein n=1 Tax=Pantoea ananas TaxID=553 RepID=UPI0003B1BB02|nr:hypothetical protein [Pantoea ananatis]ERM13562.1 hypothetical protein L585_12855 [Pantoea ananatis BRT175]ERM13574.1 hypothetical protein L585_12915 [Pantoea ananatis BRT175]ERM14116.1 hypothetical protein L585_10020 [Pantoea ananatis BRT175]PVY87831.1 hypothetical protein C7427_101275 [Pantoea ananatis]